MSCGLVFYYVLQIFLSAIWHTIWHTWRTAIMSMKNSEKIVKF